MNFRRYRPESYEFDALATFNAEQARGIVHTPEWCEKMRLEQLRFDQLHGTPPRDPGKHSHP